MAEQSTIRVFVHVDGAAPGGVTIVTPTGPHVLEPGGQTVVEVAPSIEIRANAPAAPGT